MTTMFFSQSLIALVPTTTTVITNSGSSNTIGYRIFIAPSGVVHFFTGKGTGQGKLPRTLTTKFFRDIQIAMPLSQLPVKPSCLKPISFGTSTFVAMGEERSPDISCPSNVKAKSLARDVDAIVKTLKIANIPRNQGKELPPQDF